MPLTETDLTRIARDLDAEFQGAPMTPETFAAMAQRVEGKGLRVVPDYLNRRVDLVQVVRLPAIVNPCMVAVCV